MIEWGYWDSKEFDELRSHLGVKGVPVQRWDAYLDTSPPLHFNITKCETEFNGRFVFKMIHNADEDGFMNVGNTLWWRSLDARTIEEAKMESLEWASAVFWSLQQHIDFEAGKKPIVMNS